MYVKNNGVCFVGTSEGSTSTYDSCVVGDKIYVVSNHRVSIFSADDLSYLGYFGSYGTGDGQLASPRSICSDGAYLYVADYDNYRIQKFTLVGEYVSQIGNNGSGSGEFNKPFHICYYNGLLYIADMYNNRIQVHSASNLGYVDNIPVSSVAMSSSVDEQNNCLVVDSYSDIRVFNLSTKNLERQLSPIPISYGSILSGEYLYISALLENKIYRFRYSDFSSAGEYNPGTGSLPGQLAAPLHLSIWPERNLILCGNGAFPYYVVGITPELEFKHHAKNNLIFDNKEIK